VSGRPLSLNPALRGKGRAGIKGDGRLRFKPPGPFPPVRAKGRYKGLRERESKGVRD
jgi:hypothetical protein